MLCDHHGQVYKVNDLQKANHGTTNEGKVDISFKQQKSETDPNSMMIILKIPSRKGTGDKEFVICGDYLCWINIGRSPIIHYVKLSMVNAQGQA